MAYYTTYVNATSSPSPPRSRHTAVLSQPSSPSMAVNWDDAEAYLSSDLDISFASTMSINSAPSSPTQTGRSVDPFSLGLAPQSHIDERMDISPAVTRLVVPKRTVRIHSDPSVNNRPFGVEVSNVSSPVVADSSPSIAKDTIAARPRSRTTAGLPPIRPPQFERSSASTSQKLSGTTSSGSNARARAALPSMWLQVPSAIARPSSAASNRSKRNAGVFSVSIVPLLSLCINKCQLNNV